MANIPSVHPLVAQLRAIRRDRKITQAALARRVGYNRDLLCKHERGRKPTSLRLFTDWAEALNCRLVVVPRGDCQGAPQRTLPKTFAQGSRPSAT